MRFIRRHFLNIFFFNPLGLDLGLGRGLDFGHDLDLLSDDYLLY